MPDADLAAAIKLAKGRTMRFAFILKGADGKLIVSKARIPPKEIAEAKEELGGGTLVTGTCNGPLNDLVFMVAKVTPSTLPAVLKRVIKDDAGLTTRPDVRMEGEEEEDED